MIGHGGVPIVCSFDEFHQLPPFGMKSLSNLSNPTKLHTSYMYGIISLNEYIDSTQTSTRICNGLMYKVIRQTYPAFKNALHNIRQGTMDDISVEFFAT